MHTYFDFIIKYTGFKSIYTQYIFLFASPIYSSFQLFKMVNRDFIVSEKVEKITINCKNMYTKGKMER